MLSDIDLTPSSSSSIDWSSIITPLVQGYGQYQATKLQIARAKQGLPPIDLTQYSAPPVRVATTVAPGAGTNRTLLLVGGMGLAGIALLMLMRRPRR